MSIHFFFEVTIHVGAILFVSHLYRKRRDSMADRIADGTVEKREVDRFALVFAGLVVSVAIAALVAVIAGSHSSASLIWTLAFTGFVLWMLFGGGARTLVRFAPFFGLSNRKRIALGTVAFGVGVLASHAIR